MLPKRAQDPHVVVERQPRCDGAVVTDLEVRHGCVDAGLGPSRMSLAEHGRHAFRRVPISFGGASTFAASSQFGECSTQLDRPAVDADDSGRAVGVDPGRLEYQVGTQ